MKRFILATASALALSAAPAIAETFSRDSGPITATATPANSSHAAGAALGCSSLGTAFASCAAATGKNSGVLVLPIAGAPGGDGIAYHIFYKSVGGSTGQAVVRLWGRQPTNTTCQDNTAFAGSDTDDAFLLAPPFSITPAAPAVTTGDSATYADVQNLTIGYKNLDLTSAINVYACIVTVSTDTADENNAIRLYGVATQNQH